MRFERVMTLSFQDCRGISVSAERERGPEHASRRLVRRVAAPPLHVCNNPRQRALSCEPVEDQMFATLLLITLCMTVYAFAMVAGDEG